MYSNNTVVTRLQYTCPATFTPHSGLHQLIHEQSQLQFISSAIKRQGRTAQTVCRLSRTINCRYVLVESERFMATI